MDQPSSFSTAEATPSRDGAGVRRLLGGGGTALELIVLAVFLTTAGATYWLLAGRPGNETLVSPPLMALLLVLNLVPAIALMVLAGRRVARQRAARSPIGGEGRLHVRLVATFSIIASVPTLLVVIFASLLFQYGVQFWYSEGARGMLQNASDLARGYYEQNLREVGEETVTMAGDLRDYLSQSSLTSPSFAEGYIYQVVTRKLNRSSIIEIGKDGVARTAATVDPDPRPASQLIAPQVIERLKGGEAVVVQAKPDQIEAVAQLYPGSNIYVYATRNSEARGFSQVRRAQTVLSDYEAFAARSRQLQLRFNVALFIGTLALVGIAVWIALAVADRLVRPVGELVDAARRVTAGDLSTRVAGPFAEDEIGTLSGAFNRMTQRLEAQTGALVSANNQLASRRALIEAVLSGVTAGVVSVDQAGMVMLVNSSATALLVPRGGQPAGQPLHALSPELAGVLESGKGSDIVQLRSGGEIRTLAVKIVQDETGHVITFDDITQQLLDQRRAAWSDVARRIAHEIKNPLTPIQLAAERLERRFAREVTSDVGTFRRLTETIVRQVGDLRRIVDEFSSFARMPKPVFRRESMEDIARHALFLHEVAHPEIAFSFMAEGTGFDLVCDRRQLGQALTNIVKNAVEAVEQKTNMAGQNRDAGIVGHVDMSLQVEQGQMVLAVADDGIGLPDERERMLEPYVTNRAKGTGLGLAIVKKIVEEHFATLSFADREGGGTAVTLRFDIQRLARLADEGAVRAEDSGRDLIHGA